MEKAVYVKENTGNWNIYYLCRDYPGSITHITNSSGSVVQELSYDAWGRLRIPSTQTAYTPGNEPELFLGRGYTGHEHLTQFGLINMNARLYDPALGRFLSPDPYVQAPEFSQSFNRYSYALNNPLKYTDPSGEYWLIDDLIAALIGGTVNLVINIVQGNVHSFAQGASYFGVGVVGGVLTIYVGPWVGGAVMGAGNSFVSQGFGDDGKWNGHNISGQQVLFDGIMGGLGGGLGANLGGLIAPYVSNIISSFGGQAIQQAATQAITGSATGFALGTGFALMNGESFENALEAGGKGALTGFAVGTVTGMASGMRAAHKAGENAWTGKALDTKQNTSEWNYGDHKSQTKWENQMKQRGWTEQQIDEAMFSGKSYPAINNINPSNGATRYVHPTTGRSMVIDNVTGNILHVGGNGFKY